MKQTKNLALIFLAAFNLIAISYAVDINKADVKSNLSPVGYWIQFDEDNDAGRGRPDGVIHTYFAKNDEYGKKGTLQMQIVVPLMQVNSACKLTKPQLRCNNCHNGSYNGFKYKSKNALLEGLVFAGNMQEKKATGKYPQKSPIYANGGVINPNDGKAYASEAQVQDNGKTMYAKASYIFWGKELGSKTRHWQRITKVDYEKIKADCGVLANGQYINKDKEITSKCINYPVSQFGIKSLV
jgi:uncharacterized protein (DUF2147 family)